MVLYLHCGYSDANWISDSNEIKAISGFVFTLCEGLVAWKSVKLTIYQRSIVEGELVALNVASRAAEWLKELLNNIRIAAKWLKELLNDIPILEKLIPAILIYCDNQSAIAKVHSKNHNAKTSRHIEIRYKILRKLNQNGVITLSYINTAENLADQFTKGLNKNQILKSSRGMGVKPINEFPSVATQSSWVEILQNRFNG